MNIPRSIIAALFLGGCVGTGGSDVPLRAVHIPNMCVNENRTTHITAEIDLASLLGTASGSATVEQTITGNYRTAEGLGC